MVEQLGRLDIAVNNAGINANSAAEDTGEGEWDATFAVNTKGVFLCCQVGGGAGKTGWFCMLSGGCVEVGRGFLLSREGDVPGPSHMGMEGGAGHCTSMPLAS